MANQNLFHPQGPNRNKQSAVPLLAPKIEELGSRPLKNVYLISLAASCPGLAAATADLH